MARKQGKGKPAAKKPTGPQRQRIEVGSQVLADALGLTTRRIQQLAAEGVIVKLEHDRYDLVASIKNMRELEEDNASDRETKKRYLTAKADAQELETSRLKLELVKMADVQRVFREAMTIYSGECDSMASRLAAELAGMTDPAIIRQKILAEERAARESAGKRVATLYPR
jgi:phage terminase Nu1 subunit (DNA packaging protein)